MSKLDFFRRHRNVMKEAEADPGNVPVVSQLGPKQFMAAHMKMPGDKKKSEKKSKSRRRVERFADVGQATHGIIDSFIYAIIGAIIMIILNSEVLVGIMARIIPGFRTQSNNVTNDNNVITHQLVSKITLKGMAITGIVFIVLFMVIDMFVLKNDVVKTLESPSQ